RTAAWPRSRLMRKFAPPARMRLPSSVLLLATGQSTCVAISGSVAIGCVGCGHVTLACRGGRYAVGTCAVDIRRHTQNDKSDLLRTTGHREAPQDPPVGALGVCRARFPTAMPMKINSPGS